MSFVKGCRWAWLGGSLIKASTVILPLVNCCEMRVSPCNKRVVVRLAIGLPTGNS